MKIFETIKRAAAGITDALADVGSRMPGLSQITIAAPGGSITVTPTPSPAAPAACPHCGAPKR